MVARLRSGSRGGPSGETPLPFTQIAVLMGVRLAEPIIFPFINQMVEDLGVTDNPDRVGFYSGLVIGRKPVIIIGLTGVAISGSFFGLATNFWTMIFIRSISGALNGNVAVVKAAIGDITDESNSTEAFAMYGLTWTIGSIIGNSMGGILSHPYERFPGVFGEWEIFRIHPYLLPCIVSALFTLVGIIFAAVFYVESLPTLPSTPPSQSITLRLLSSRHNRVDSSVSINSETETLVGSPSSKDRDGDDELDAMSPVSPTTPKLISKMPQGVDSPVYGGNERKGWGFKDLMRYRPMRMLCLTMFLNSFVGGAWAAVSLLFFFDRSEGLNMSPAAIGTASAINGFWSIACQLLLLNRIRRWLGIATAYKVLSFGWIPLWFFFPLLRDLLEATESPLASDGSASPRYGDVRKWPVTLGVNGLLSYVTVVGMANSLLMVLINYSSPDRTALGAVNGIATAVSCMARVIGPSTASALFAVSMDGKILGGRLWWIFMAIMSTFNWTACLFITQDPAKKALQTIDEEDEDELEEV
ncbi:hypothetical protein JCM24511_03340 [Saitozyma sp. JCM 24511]|nr:hypothetical protein JCM24511_03340 [Saitozyma sp. JCM 24511]